MSKSIEAVITKYSVNAAKRDDSNTTEYKKRSWNKWIGKEVTRRHPDTPERLLLEILPPQRNNEDELAVLHLNKWEDWPVGSITYVDMVDDDGRHIRITDEFKKA